MSDYNIEVEISIDEGLVRVESISGEYVYDLDSEKGATLLARVLGSDTQTTVYAQGNTFNSIDEYNEWAERRNENVY